MPASTFIALQCFHCSTMQVKQQKKSSNKWTCVVCNQKQSVRKVFAQGPLAKDLRKFVQSFNMSRKFADDQLFLFHETQPSTAGGVPPKSEDLRTKRPTDWSEYLDLEQEDRTEEGGDLGPEIVTELPRDMFKKPKLKNYVGRSGVGDNGDDALYNPVFLRGKKNSIVKSQDDEMQRKHEAKKKTGTSEWSKYTTDDNEPKNCKRKKASEASKWSAYLSEEDEVGGAGEVEKEEPMNQCSWEALVEDEKVGDDDIHPDFV